MDFLRKEYYNIIYAVYKIAIDNKVSSCRKVFFDTFSEYVDILYKNFENEMKNNIDNLNPAKVNKF